MSKLLVFYVGALAGWVAASLLLSPPSPLPESAAPCGGEPAAPAPIAQSEDRP